MHKLVFPYQNLKIHVHTRTCKNGSGNYNADGSYNPHAHISYKQTFLFVNYANIYYQYVYMHMYVYYTYMCSWHVNESLLHRWLLWSARGLSYGLRLWRNNNGTMGEFMYVCTHVCMYVCMYVCICEDACGYLCVIRTDRFLYIKHICMYDVYDVHTNTCIHVCIGTM